MFAVSGVFCLLWFDVLGNQNYIFLFLQNSSRKKWGVWLPVRCGSFLLHSKHSHVWNKVQLALLCCITTLYLIASAVHRRMFLILIDDECVIYRMVLNQPWLYALYSACLGKEDPPVWLWGFSTKDQAQCGPSNTRGVQALERGLRRHCCTFVMDQTSIGSDRCFNGHSLIKERDAGR